MLLLHQLTSYWFDVVAVSAVWLLLICCRFINGVVISLLCVPYKKTDCWWVLLAPLADWFLNAVFDWLFLPHQNTCYCFDSLGDWFLISFFFWLIRLIIDLLTLPYHQSSNWFVVVASQTDWSGYWFVFVILQVVRLPSCCHCFTSSWVIDCF